MAIFGIGATWSGDDKVELFLSENVAAMGYDSETAPTQSGLMDKIEVGDTVFIKSFSPGNGLYVKAVGTVLEDSKRTNKNVGNKCVEVNWIWVAEDPKDTQSCRRYDIPDDKFVARGITVYEETHPEIQREIINLL